MTRDGVEHVFAVLTERGIELNAIFAVLQGETEFHEFRVAGRAIGIELGVRGIASNGFTGQQATCVELG